MKQTTRTAKSPGAAPKKGTSEKRGKTPTRSGPGHHGEPESPGPKNPIPEMPGKPGRDVPEIPGEPGPDRPFPEGDPEGDKMIFRGAQHGVEGEGSHSAARRYDEGVARSVARGDSDELAEEAAGALDGPEGEELRRAEREGKQGHPPRRPN